MKIEILGTGCAKCVALEKVVQEALAKVGGFHQVEKVDDIMEIMKYNVVSTPGLVIDGEVKSTGKLLSVDEVVKLIEEAQKNA
ncbi:redox-active disulfide protein [Sulfurovum lithotrophicum]|uniref:Redox-active disulfide protein n=1 Tax=Sulfurovum lithotrophicum TaxID=206403 RepID=A0A7U4RQQ7_9BACT|nr:MULTISPECIES: thioredoxin family protein [Sulfurovum]AKF25065.1 redox-active disulfide protein [Sulfurovum lithotrophicum]BAF72369.1 redox-active disulfide protein 2 [Sulfurovum sp. NBC37-1]